MMKTFNKNILSIDRISIVIIVAAMINFIGCNKSNQPIDADQSILVNESQIDKISLSPNQFKSAEMTLGKMTNQNFYKSVKANGVFDVPPENKASVSVYFGGYVKEIHLLPGEIVKKGQVLFTLENPDYIQIQQDFLEAEGQLKYLKSDYERQKSLIEDKIASQKNYLKAESDYKITFSKYQSLKKKLELMNININSILKGNLVTTIKILSPINGSVTSVKAVKGLFLSPQDVAITITNTDHMHIELKVFESDISSLKKDQDIIFTQPNNPNQKYEAQIHLINPFIESDNRTAMVHGHLKDEKQSKLFLPGMYIEAEILTANQSLSALPQEAIVNIEDEYYVLVREGTDTGKMTFSKVKVSIGEEQNGYIPILNSQNFKMGNEFLIKGAFNLIRE